MKNPFQIPNIPHALPMRPWCEKGELTWEDFYAEAKKKYPVRYFLSHDLPHWWRVHVSLPIEHFTDWVVCHVVPSRRFHMLDLRQPKDEEGYPYRYGWIDSDRQILYSCFNILVRFIEREHGGKDKYLEYIAFQEEDCSQEFPEWQEKCRNQREILDIYLWWKETRPATNKAISEALTKWHDLYRPVQSKEEAEVTPGLAEADKLHKDLEAAYEVAETKRLARLIELRHLLWT